MIKEILNYYAGVTSTGFAPMGTVTIIEKPSGDGKKKDWQALPFIKGKFKPEFLFKEQADHEA